MTHFLHMLHVIVVIHLVSFRLNIQYGAVSLCNRSWNNKLPRNCSGTAGQLRFYFSALLTNKNNRGGYNSIIIIFLSFSALRC